MRELGLHAPRTLAGGSLPYSIPYPAVPPRSRPPAGPVVQWLAIVLMGGFILSFRPTVDDGSTGGWGEDAEGAGELEEGGGGAGARGGARPGAGKGALLPMAQPVERRAAPPLDVEKAARPAQIRSADQVEKAARPAQIRSADQVQEPSNSDPPAAVGGEAGGEAGGGGARSRLYAMPGHEVR